MLDGHIRTNKVNENEKGFSIFFLQTIFFLAFLEKQNSISTGQEGLARGWRGWGLETEC